MRNSEVHISNVGLWVRSQTTESREDELDSWILLPQLPLHLLAQSTEVRDLQGGQAAGILDRLPHTLQSDVLGGHLLDAELLHLGTVVRQCVQSLISDHATVDQ